jgi:hypothetical protein
MISLADKLTSGLARLAPFGRQAEDPLTNIKTATRWIENLAMGDAFKCQQAILGELRRFNENSTPPTKDRLAVLMLLDERSRDLQDTLVRQYLSNPRMSRAGEDQLWHAVYGLYWEVARGYHTVVLQLTGEASKSRPQELIPLTTLRAIRAFGQLLKWRAITIRPAGNKLWLRLHKLYRAAERQGFHRQPQRAYVEEASVCSCEAAYLHILMLNLANSGALPQTARPGRHLVCSWHGMLHLDNDPAPTDHTFSVELSADHGARRLRKAEAGKPFRYWTTAALVKQLHVLHSALREGRLPATLGLKETARPTESLELLEHLQRQWSSLANREQRRVPRESIKRLVDVVHGLNSIISQIKTADTHSHVSPYETGLSSSEIDDMLVYGFVTGRTLERSSHTRPPSALDDDSERWVMQDESEYGYGAIVESGDKDWLRVGALVGLKPHDAHEWRIGIVRRLARLGQNTSSVGIETLAETAALAMLHDTTPPGYTVNGFDNSGASLPHASLWLAGGPHAGSVIIDPVHYMPGKIWGIHGIPERTFIALRSPIDRSEGWVHVAAEPVNG